jgi:phosphoserine aminotransferase
MSVIEHAKLLLDKSWSEEEKQLIKKMIDNLNFYKSLIPKALKSDIIAVFELANRIKDEYDILKSGEKTYACACVTKE